MIQFENVSKKYPDGTYATHSLNFTIQEGEFFVLIGPSGCGKTTTLKLINRLIDLTDGTIFFNEKKISEYDIHELRWNIGYVLQQIALFPHMTIEENIAVVPELKKWSRDKIRSRVDELLEMVGLDPDTYRDRKPSELSGGQQQRVGVVRALAADPQIILMDEPFSALDPISREKIQNDLIDLQKRIKKTIVFVTHDMQEALKLGDRICLMNEGEIVQIDTPEVMIEKPVNQFAEEFIGNGATQMIGMAKVEKIAQKHVEGIENISGMTAISAETPIIDVLSLLANEEMIAVEKNGAAIGVVTREAALQFISENMSERRV
ncbi:osmoprotectant transport system ATP-binding protein [Bacillus ectoiniformans]|uniref:ABC transporter ATP-binding protein n=1 Tax=Bacillus ectoiniformans TaxID=1494429 RepID=UPI001956CA6C|nr:ABC transporter ATP-binding protein [Bacillus ectoiniformans]MBM7649129.1 osmoprotectant transport system ATP-binding protein [Bacillus ectoiniformans]